ncbi:hypothetical protein O0I10_006257 [Lichtheimia ornata]|uniref:F-box domain-containing protein n=1 Tax=Lichtheimia ornata TaxID=688661 RepID=A0AAD7V5H8_9FUNG|nr:uncharacterized protein O0I10_006257 [Lichtheimia ornata]KAJ8657986.1 hypothetical protein O0I10_006257 [Lichtheimia ornata]
MTQMHDTTILTLPAITCYYGQGKNIISAATKEINQLTCRFIENLNERSTALANGANFDLALRDAAFMRLLNPTSSIGYLKAGTIYQQQGRRKEAAAMYEEGIANVPSSDDGYTNLQKQHAHALSASNKRIDFISQLPLDLVVSTTLPLVFHNYKLSPHTRCPYLYVSRTWQQRILQRNDLRFDIPRSDGMPHPDGNQLIKFAPHVKSLTVGDWDEKKPKLRLCAIFNDLDFIHLTHLSIYCNEEDTLIDILESIGRTLTHLEVYNIDDLPFGADLNCVWDVCANLVSLEVIHVDIQPPSVQYRTLKHLNMRSTYMCPFTSTVINDTLAKFPSLLSVVVSPMPEDTQFITRIQHHCPKLKLFTCGGDSYFQCKYQNQNGLEKLSVGDGDEQEPYDAEGLIQLLLRNHRSLNQVILGGNLQQGRVSLDEEVEFERLEDIEVDAVNDEFVELAASIIRRAPHLRSINIGIRTGDDQDIFDLIKTLPHLRRLAAEKIHPDSPSLYNCFQHHVNLGSHSPLKHLKIEFDEMTWESPWVCAMAELPNLETLVISVFEMPDDYVSIIEMIAKGCPSLTYLELNCDPYDMPDGTVALLKDHPTLEGLCLDAPFISDSDIMSVLTIPKLNRFIFNAPIKDYIVDLLRRNITKVVNERAGERYKAK